MTRKRVLILFAVLAFVVAVAAGSWVIGSRIESPAEAAARTAPPQPSPILVPVERRVLSSNVVTRGTARYGLPQALSIVRSRLKPDIGIIATLPERGDEIDEGDVVLTASARPVFLLKGKVPAFRDLVPGLSGEDVRQLEAALARLGFDPGEADGTYDAKTGGAVEAWYRAAGFEPFGPTQEQLAEIRALEKELAVATNEALSAADAATAGPLMEQAARAKAADANAKAAAVVAAKRTARDQTITEEGSTTSGEATAEAELEAALAAAEATRLAGALEVLSAAFAARAAERDAALAKDIEAKLTAELEAANSKLGTQVPADEIVFVPELPVRIEQLDAKVGEVASGPIIKVTDRQLSIDSSLPLTEALLVKPGFPVAIDEPDLGITATGVVKRVAERPGTDGADGFHVYFETHVEETDATLEGYSLRLTIPVESSGGEVTAVPVSALSMAADGSTRVQVDRAGGSQYVVVEPGLSADGYVEVTAVDAELEPGEMVVVGFE